MLLSVHVTSVPFLVWFNNFTLTMHGLLELHTLILVAQFLCTVACALSWLHTICLVPVIFHKQRERITTCKFLGANCSHNDTILGVGRWERQLFVCFSVRMLHHRMCLSAWLTASVWLSDCRTGSACTVWLFDWLYRGSGNKTRNDDTTRQFDKLLHWCASWLYNGMV